MVWSISQPCLANPFSNLLRMPNATCDPWLKDQHSTTRSLPTQYIFQTCLCTVQEPYSTCGRKLVPICIQLQLSVIATNYDVMGFRVPSSFVNTTRPAIGNLRCTLTGPCLLKAETAHVKFKLMELVHILLHYPISIYLAKVRTASW
jgi:hypothetical protein